MARPTKCRRICTEPVYDSFTPDKGLPGESIILTVDEYETIWLIDLEELTHEQCARLMDVSRTTVTELYGSARYKVADSIVHGKRLCISGGHYKVCDGAHPCCRKRCAKASRTGMMQTIGKEGTTAVKIAVTYENGEIFQHFGHTEQFKLYTVEDGKITAEQVVGTNGSGHGALAGFLKNAGVDVLICGGIGGGAQEALHSVGIRLYGGVSGKANEAVAALLDGTLGFDPNVHCDHHDHGHGGEGHTCGEHGCHQN